MPWASHPAHIRVRAGRVTSPSRHDLPILQPHDQVGVLVDQRVVRRHQEGGALLLDDAPEQAEDFARGGAVQLAASLDESGISGILGAGLGR